MQPSWQRGSGVSAYGSIASIEIESENGLSGSAKP